MVDLKFMIIDCISDLHGHFPKLEGGDLLLIAGDITISDKVTEWNEFYDWLDVQPYRKKIVIAGNHDKRIDADMIGSSSFSSYLQDSGTVFEGFNIWGSPWTLSFYGMNPCCKAFTVKKEEQLIEKWKLIPKNTDILITHSPPFGIQDAIYSNNFKGSITLRNYSMSIPPKLHVFGHIHNGYGKVDTTLTKFINASLVNDDYDPVNKPIRIVL